jgi:hypothetical protein
MRPESAQCHGKKTKRSCNPNICHVEWSRDIP